MSLPLRFLANENWPRNAVETLGQAGFDIAWVRTDAPGSTDDAVLDRAIRENRIPVTFDKDFGELAWNAALPPACGVILFRLRMPWPEKVASVLTAIVTSRDDWAGHFSVVEAGRVRMRPLPSTR